MGKRKKKKLTEEEIDQILADNPPEPFPETTIVSSEDIVFVDESIDPVQEWKNQLKILYVTRPIYNGREYKVLHKWYSQLEALTR